MAGLVGQVQVVDRYGSGKARDFIVFVRGRGWRNDLKLGHSKTDVA